MYSNHSVVVYDSIIAQRADQFWADNPEYILLFMLFCLAISVVFMLYISEKPGIQ